MASYPVGGSTMSTPSYGSINPKGHSYVMDLPRGSEVPQSPDKLPWWQVYTFAAIFALMPLGVRHMVVSNGVPLTLWVSPMPAGIYWAKPQTGLHITKFVKGLRGHRLPQEATTSQLPKGNMAPPIYDTATPVGASNEPAESDALGAWLLGACTATIAAFLWQHPRWAISTVTAVAEAPPVDAGAVPCISIARLRVANLHCDLECRLVDETLMALAGVRKVMINLISKLVIVQYDAQVVTCMNLVEELNRHKLGCTIQDNGQETESRGVKLTSVLSGLYYILQTGMVMGILYLHAVAHPPLILKRAMWTYLAVGSPPIVQKAIWGIREGRPDLGLLILMAMGSAIALNDLFDAVLVVFLFSLANAFEAMCLARIHRSLQGLHGNQSTTAVLAEPGRIGVAVKVEEVTVGTLLQVRAGEHIPLDGVVVAGSASIDESAVTGESTPLSKGVKDAVYGGSMVQNGFITIRTTGSYATSTLSRIQSIVQEAQAQASPTALLVDRFASVYSPVIIGVAGFTMLLPFLLGLPSVESWLHTGLLILILACPCSMVLSTPIATVCAITTAAQSQVLIKAGGAALDRLAKLQVLAVDKTGTLTEGHFRVTGMFTVAGDCCKGDNHGHSHDHEHDHEHGHDHKHDHEHEHEHGHEHEHEHDHEHDHEHEHEHDHEHEHEHDHEHCDSHCHHHDDDHHHHHHSDDHGHAHDHHDHDGHDHDHASLTDHQRDILQVTASLQSASTHPIAAAILAYVVGQQSGGCLTEVEVQTGEGYGLPVAKDVIIHEGQGLSGVVEGRKILAGNWELMKAHGVSDGGDLAKKTAERWLQDAKTVVFVAINGTLELILALSDAIKPDATRAIRELQAEGVRVALLTGDTVQSAAAVAHDAGISEYRGRMAPVDKVQYVRDAKAAGQVVGMVGDGINDGPALAHSDLGIAMGSGGTALAAQAADVVLMSDRLTLIPAVRRLAQRCQRVVLVNLVLSIGIKLGTLVATLFVSLPVWTAIISDALALGLVIANGLTLLRPLRVEVSHA